MTNIFTHFLHICIIYSFNTSTTRIRCKEIEGKKRWERLEISARKLEIPREHFMQNGLDKGQKW